MPQPGPPVGVPGPGADVIDPPGWSIPPVSPGINEAASTVTGTYQGKPTTGQAYVEQLGIWK